jgi:photosystem II stability/assembly factor-like uncharacterized protein
MAIVLSLQAGNAQSVTQEPYQWKNVQIVGGGFVDGIIFHPRAKDVRYCRTDMGGAYRWDASAKRWVSMLDWIPYTDNNLVGVESIAVDPNDPLTVYLSCGTNTGARSPYGAVLRSTDGGKTFLRIDVPFKMGGNENGRGNGERMMVDPANSNIVYLGTRLDGLWRSADKGLTWSQVSTFPDVTEAATVARQMGQPAQAAPAGTQPGAPSGTPAGFGGQRASRGSGVIFVVFDPSTAVAGKGCSTTYVGVSLMNRDNFFVSRDNGNSWKPVPGQPDLYRTTHGVLSTDGSFYISYGTDPGPNRMQNGAVWKYNTKTGEWINITPVKPDVENGKTFGYAAVSVDLQNPQHVIASTFCRPVNKALEDDIFRSTDGGKTWKPIFESGGKFDYSNAPYVQFTPLHWMFDIEIDPFNSDHAMFTTGYGGWETFNLSAIDQNQSTQWQVMSKGIDETVPLELLSPREGAHLITAVGDYGGFAHFDLDRPEPAGSFSNPYFANTNGLAYAENVPNLVVRVGAASAHHVGGHIAYSTDGGKSWTPPATVPAANYRLGHIAVSPDGETWIWAPERAPVFYTKDRGATWTACQGIPNNTRVIADKVNSKLFYALNIFEGKLYESKDGGVTFTARDLNLPDGIPARGNRGDTRGGQDRVYSTPGRENDLWIAAFDGLYHANPGEAFVKQGKVQEMHAFGFGKEAPGAAVPALYMVGKVNGVHGFFRSDDWAQNWVRINDDQHQYGLVLHITGDPKKYGRVYVGTHGRGAVYGDPVKNNHIIK